MGAACPWSTATGPATHPGGVNAPLCITDAAPIAPSRPAPPPLLRGRERRLPRAPATPDTAADTGRWKRPSPSLPLAAAHTLTNPSSAPTATHRLPPPSTALRRARCSHSARWSAATDVTREPWKGSDSTSLPPVANDTACTEPSNAPADSTQGPRAVPTTDSAAPHLVTGACPPPSRARHDRRPAWGTATAADHACPRRRP
mmetsp:Transcript_9123/g.28863  ORF Transcript_9123/g.28863 Transcript_9123/m.28863 type:complete len:202 (+) Transcript_9123:530-1135(+)